MICFLPFEYGDAEPLHVTVAEKDNQSGSMPELTEKTISCPYCGEAIFVSIDDSLPEQRYVEDCQVCCRPIVLEVSVDAEGDVAVKAWSENE